MKHFTSISKKTLSLILAMILITACAAVPAWASIDPVAPSIGTTTDRSVIARVVDVPAGIEYQFCAIPSTVSVTTDILDAAAWTGSTTNEVSTATLKADHLNAAITASTSYKVFSRAYDVSENKYYTDIKAYASVTTLVAAPQAPAAGVVAVDSAAATHTSVSFTVSGALTGLEYSVNNGASWSAVTLTDSKFTVEGLNHSTTYTFYFRYKSSNGQADATYPDGVLAVTAATKVKDPWTPAPDAPVLSGFRSDTEIGITFVSDDYDYYVNGVKNSFEKRSTASGSSIIVVTGLAAGTNYSITCVKRADAEHCDSAQSAATSAATKSVPGIPSGQSTYLITDSTISMNYSENVAYACVPFGSAAPETGWKSGSVSADNVITHASFTGLLPGTKYSIYYKYLETTNQVESAVSPAPLSVTTKLASAPAPANDVAPVIIDKSMSAIKVAEVSGVEFCIGLTGGSDTVYSNWQTSGTFNGLAADTNYSIKARYVCDTAVQMPGKENIQSAYTTARVGYAASIGNCKITSNATVIRANGAFEVTVTGDRPAASLGALVYGDTRIVPIAYYTSENATVVPINTSRDNTDSFSVTPSKTGQLTITVIFASQKYKGTDSGNNAIWDDLGNITSFETFTVKEAKSSKTDFLDGLVKVINIFTNVIPKLILAIIGMFNKK